MCGAYRGGPAAPRLRPPFDRWVSAHANIRVASAARRGYGEALVICFRGGAFSAVLDLTLCVAGVTLLYVVLYAWYVARGELDNTDIPVLMVGYGFGASFVALFMQVCVYMHVVSVGVARSERRGAARKRRGNARFEEKWNGGIT